MPLVLSNDDGVHAEGLATLYSVLRAGAECLIVAPSGFNETLGETLT